MMRAHFVCDLSSESGLGADALLVRPFATQIAEAPHAFLRVERVGVTNSWIHHVDVCSRASRVVF